MSHDQERIFIRAPPFSIKTNSPKELGQIRLEAGILEYRDPLDNIWKPAVRLQTIRPRLIEEAPPHLYKFAKERGHDTADVTTFLAKDQQYGSDREHRDPLLFQITTDGIRGEKPTSYLKDGGLIVLDPFNHGIRDFPQVLPKCLSSSLGGYDIMNYFRQNSALRLYDLIVRMPDGYQEQDANGNLTRHNGVPRYGTVGMRATRFRLQAGLLTWRYRMGSNDRNEKILSLIPAHCKEINSTASHRDFTAAEQAEVTKLLKGTAPNRRRHADQNDDGDDEEVLDDVVKPAENQSLSSSQLRQHYQPFELQNSLPRGSTRPVRWVDLGTGEEVLSEAVKPAEDESTPVSQPIQYQQSLHQQNTFPPENVRPVRWIDLTDGEEEPREAVKPAEHQPNPGSQPLQHPQPLHQHTSLPRETEHSFRWAHLRANTDRQSFLQALGQGSYVPEAAGVWTDGPINGLPYLHSPYGGPPYLHSPYGPPANDELSPSTHNAEFRYVIYAPTQAMPASGAMRKGSEKIPLATNENLQVYPFTGRQPNPTPAPVQSASLYKTGLQRTRDHISKGSPDTSDSEQPLIKRRRAVSSNHNEPSPNADSTPMDLDGPTLLNPEPAPTSPAEDYRFVAPGKVTANMLAIKEALKLTRKDFRQKAGFKAPLVLEKNHGHKSYHDQRLRLQTVFERIWKGEGPPPELYGLPAWTGGFSGWKIPDDKGAELFAEGLR